MAWFHPEWYHRVISCSGTFVNQQWPFNPANPGDAMHDWVTANHEMAAALGRKHYQYQYTFA